MTTHDTEAQDDSRKGILFDNKGWRYPLIIEGNNELTDSTLGKAKIYARIRMERFKAQDRVYLRVTGCGKVRSIQHRSLSGMLIDVSAGGFCMTLSDNIMPSWAMATNLKLQIPVARRTGECDTIEARLRWGKNLDGKLCVGFIFKDEINDAQINKLYKSQLKVAS